jgi:aryl-alcohol dehydrogenase
MAARIGGATTIIAVDIAPNRLELAVELGATHMINSRETDPVVAIDELTGGGVDFSVESSGRPAVLRQAIGSLGKRGTCGVVGVPPAGSELGLDIRQILMGQ